MTEFRYSICEPLNPKVIEKGMIAPDSVIGLFNDFQWDYYLKQIEVAETRKMDIYFSPSLQDTILESLRAGADVTIKTLDDRSTTLVEENTWKIAQITGYLVNNGEFAQGDYTGERARAERRELEESLRRSDRVAYER